MNWFGLNGGGTYFYNIETRSTSLNQEWVSNSVNPLFAPNLSDGCLHNKPCNRFYVKIEYTFISDDKFNFSGNVNSSLSIDS